MYESHFGLSGPPFQLVPDPSFYFSSKGHSNALAFLKFGAHQGEGFIVVTGEIGAGKTTLVRTLLDGLDPASVVAAPVISTQLEPGELPLAILMAFGVAGAGEHRAQLLGRLEAFLTDLSAKGRRALLIVDEAQNLPIEVIEELRLLTNFQLGRNAMLQVFLIGQPELRTTLQSKAMDQMRQRVTASCHLGPLDPAETRAYVEHRLRLVGWTDTPRFEPDAFQQLHRWTGGIPRRINRLCNRLLLSAFLETKDAIVAEDVEQIAQDLRAEIGEADEIPPLVEDTVDALPAAPKPTGEPIEIMPLKDVSAHDDDAGAAIGPSYEPHAAAQDVASTPVGVVAAHEETQADSTRPNPARELKPDATKVALPMAPVQPVAEPIPVLRPVPDIESAGAAAGLTQAALHGRPEISGRRNANAAEPLICLVDSAADYVKARALARVCAVRPKLPAVMTVHTGFAADADVGEGLSGVMPASANDVHLGIDERGGAASVASALLGFDAVLKEHSPSAVLAMGSGDTLLACSLLAHKSGVPVLRNDAGRRRAWAWAGEEMNAVLLERFADISYINDLATYYTLYRVGIATDRVICVGDLADNVVHFAADHTVQPDEVLRRADIPTAHLKSQHGYAVATTQIQPRDDLRRYVENLSARLIEVGRLLPVFWAINAFTLREVQTAGLQARLAAANVVLIPSLGYLDCLDLMRRARCLIAGSTGDYLDEAVSLGVQTLVLGKDIVVPVKGGESVQQNVAQGVDKLGKLVAEVLAATPNRRPAAAKWDGGPAARIADHLEAWLPKQKKAKARQAPVPRVRPLEPSAKLA
jgi:general secretion pathway protein A